MSELKLPTGENPILKAFRAVTALQEAQSKQLVVDLNAGLFVGTQSPKFADPAHGESTPQSYSHYSMPIVTSRNKG